MNGHAAFGALALLGASGCASTVGHSQAFVPSQLVSSEGWLVAGRWGVSLSLDAAVQALEAAGTEAAGAGGRGARLGDLRDLARTIDLKADDAWRPAGRPALVVIGTGR